MERSSGKEARLLFLQPTCPPPRPRGLEVWERERRLQCKEPQDPAGWSLGGDTAEWQRALRRSPRSQPSPQQPSLRRSSRPTEQPPMGTRHRPMVPEIKGLGMKCAFSPAYNTNESQACSVQLERAELGPQVGISEREASTREEQPSD